MIFHLSLISPNTPIGEPQSHLATALALVVSLVLCFLIACTVIGFVYDFLEPPITETNHTLSTDAASSEAASSEKGEPSKKTHQLVDDLTKCLDCHEWGAKRDAKVPLEKGVALALKKPIDSCYTCHDIKKFEAEHSHHPEPLQDCGRCHILHGTTELQKGLLRSSGKILCTQCHEER